MPAEVTMPAAVSLELHRAVSRWSDTQRARIENIADKYRDLRIGLHPPLSNAQLSGILAYLTTPEKWADQKHFIRHQREKADKAERRDNLADFWKDLEQAGDTLQQQDAKMVWAQALQAAGKAGSGFNPNKPPDIVHQLLLREFVQHLVSHALYLATQG
jgi:hypothetical protein